MSGASGSALLRDLLIISGLIGVQIINSVYTVLLAPFLARGLNPLFLTIFGSLATSICVLPLAIACERKRWPARLTLTLMSQFALMAVGGPASQVLMFIGIKKTSPAIASAMPNLVPGIIFAIAACLGFERIDIKCTNSRAKIAGTIVCLGGALAMSFLQSPSSASTPSSPALHDSAFGDWIVGCLCLLGTVLVASCSTVLQAITMINFPAPFTLCVVTSSMGAVFTVLVQILMEGKLDAGSSTISFSTIVVIALLAGMLTSVCIGFQTWAVKKKGPVLASMFSPIQTVCSAVLSAIILGQFIKLGSLAGMILMFLGLYMVLWAKKKEGSILSKESTDTHEPTYDVEKPLLS